MQKLIVFIFSLLLVGCGSGESGGKEQKPAPRNNQRNDAGRQQMPAEDPQPSGGESPVAGDGDQVKDDVNLIQNLKYYGIIRFWA